MSRMAMTEKGPIEPAPMMSPLLQTIVDKVASWPMVTIARHRDLHVSAKSDGTDFHVGDVDDPAFELGHVHFDGSIHLATTAELRAALKAAKLAQPLPWYNDWVMAKAVDPASARRAVWLFQLNYDRLVGAGDSILLQRVLDESPALRPDCVNQRL